MSYESISVKGLKRVFNAKAGYRQVIDTHASKDGKCAYGRLYFMDENAITSFPIVTSEPKCLYRDCMVKCCAQAAYFNDVDVEGAKQGTGDGIYTDWVDGADWVKKIHAVYSNAELGYSTLSESFYSSLKRVKVMAGGFLNGSPNTPFIAMQIKNGLMYMGAYREEGFGVERVDDKYYPSTEVWASGMMSVRLSYLEYFSAKEYRNDDILLSLSRGRVELLSGSKNLLVSSWLRVGEEKNLAEVFDCRVEDVKPFMIQPTAGSVEAVTPSFESAEETGSSEAVTPSIESADVAGSGEAVTPSFESAEETGSSEAVTPSFESAEETGSSEAVTPSIESAEETGSSEAVTPSFESADDDDLPKDFLDKLNRIGYPAQIEDKRTEQAEAVTETKPAHAWEVLAGTSFSYETQSADVAGSVEAVETKPLTWKEIEALSPEAKKAYAVAKAKQKRRETQDAIDEIMETGGIETDAGFLTIYELLDRLNRNSPCAHYSDMNKMIVIAHDTIDARSFMAWKSAGRKVKKGAKAFSVMKPCVFKSTPTADGEELEATAWTFQPVFRYEDTEGREIDYTPMREIEAIAV